MRQKRMFSVRSGGTQTYGLLTVALLLGLPWVGRSRGQWISSGGPGDLYSWRKVKAGVDAQAQN